MLSSDKVHFNPNLKLTGIIIAYMYMYAYLLATLHA